MTCVNFLMQSVEEDLRDKIEKVNMKLESVSNSTADTRSQVRIRQINA